MTLNLLRMLGRPLSRVASAGLLGLSLVVSVATPAWSQDFVLTTLVLIDSTNTTGYNPSSTSPGEFQRNAQRYLEHLQIPYETIDVSTQMPPDLSRRQLIVSGHSGLDLSDAWRNALVDAVQVGIGFVNLDAAPTVGQQSHLQAIFNATGSTQGATASTIRIPQAVLSDGTSPHYIAALQRRFTNDPAGDIVYNFHRDAGGALRTVQSTVLTGATGTIIATVGPDPLIRATTYGGGRAVHFGTLEYLRADRFGFMRGVDDLFWRSLVWAARKPFVVRGYPRFWAVQMDDTLDGWGTRVRDMYDTSLTGVRAPDGTGGPWRVTGYVFTDYLPTGDADRISVIADINAGLLQVSPHARGESYGDLYWEDEAGQPLTQATWALTVDDIQAWMNGSGGADRIPFISRSMVPHFWNLSSLTGSEMWDVLGIRYITEIQRPGMDFFNKTDADRLRARPFRLYELPPMLQPDENYPIYLADSYSLDGRTFFNFATQMIDLVRYDRQDLAWPNTTRPVTETIDQFEYYTWRLWSGLAPVQIYTHDGSNNYILSTEQQRRQVIQSVSGWLNANSVRHVFMQDLGDYMYARTNSVLTRAEALGGSLTLTFTGNSATADGVPVTTELLVFTDDDEGSARTVGGFTGGTTATVSYSNPVPATSALSPSSATVGAAPFTLTVTGTGFTTSSTVRWNGSNRTTTFVSSTELRAAIPAADVATAGTPQVTVSNPGPGGGVSNPRTFTVVAGNNPIPTTGGLSPAAATVGGPNFTLTVTGTNFVAASVVRWNGANRSTTVLSATQLTAAIPAADIATAGSAEIRVFNPTPGGGLSNPQTLPIGNAVPTTASLSPSSAVAGGSAFTLTVNGGGFANISIVRWNGADRPTTFVSTSQLTAAIPATDVAFQGTAEVTVFTPAPGGGTSNAQTFTVGSPTTGFVSDDFNRPDGASLGNGWIEKTPGAFALAGNRVTKAATATGFADNLVYRPVGENMLNGEVSLEVRFATMPPGYAQVLVRGQTATIGNAGVFNGYLLFTDNDPTRAVLSRIENSTFNTLATLNLAGGLNTTDTFRLRLRATGTNPVTVTAFVERLSTGAWQIIGQTTVDDATATRFATAGTTGFTGYVEGGIYSYDNFTRTSFDSGSGENPTPTTSALSPASAPAGSPAFVLTVDGAGFVPGSVVRWNGADRPTTFVSTNQLTAAIAAADVASAGTAQVTVFTPAPGGGTSNAQTFTMQSAVSGNLLDTFDRADSGGLGNGWIEKTPAAFALAGNRVTKAATATGFADNLVYRPAAENILDGEASLEMRFASMPPGYAQVFVRGQTATIANAGVFSGYLLFTDNNSTRAILSRVENGVFNNLATLNLSTALNITDTFRLRLRATGTNPVVVSAFVERLSGTTWQAIGQVTVNDAAATRFATPGTVGFTGYIEGGVYTFDNFTRTSLDGQIAITEISPASAVAGDPGFTLTVEGQNFLLDSVVRWNGADRATTFVSITELRATIPAADVATSGVAQITVFTPSAGDITSDALTFSVIVPGASFSDNFNRPDNPTLGNGWTEKFPDAFAIQNNEVVNTDTGTIDYHDTIVYRPATEDQRDVEVGLEFRVLPGMNFPQLHARVQRSSITQPDTLEGYLLFVDGFEPSPGRAIIAHQAPVQGQFECYMLAIPFPSPLQTTDRYRLRFQVAGANPVTLTGIIERLVGTTWELFASGTTVHDDTTQADPNLFCDPGFMSPPISTAGAVGFAKWVTNNEVIDNFYWVNLTQAESNPAPTAVSLSPSSTTAGGPTFTLTVNGSNFVSGSVVRWNGSNRATTFVSAAQLTASIPASDISTAGTAQVTVFTPTPGGGTSAPLTFTVSSGSNPAPTAVSLSPSSTTAGGPTFTLTVNGSNFVSGSVVRWNGSNRATTFVSAAQLTASIQAGDIATAGTAQVTVFTPTPGGGTSAPLTFTVSGGGGGASTTTVTFDNPVPPGNPDSFLNGLFQGIDFGRNQWRWGDPFGPDPTRHVYFGSASGTSRMLTFSPGPRRLVSMRVFTLVAGTLTLTDNLGQTWTQGITTGSMQLVTTNWAQASTAVTVTFTAGWELGVDDIVYSNP